jgi:hypothetical protein
MRFINPVRIGMEMAPGVNNDARPSEDDWRFG